MDRKTKKKKKIKIEKASIKQEDHKNHIEFFLQGLQTLMIYH